MKAKASRIISDPGYFQLKEHVIGHTGLAYYADKDEDLAIRIQQRLQATGAPDCRAYLKLLEPGVAGQQEMNALIGAMTIGETYFFRQPEHFEALRRTIFPDLIERNRTSRRLRIWSAGCANGAEPYSVALLLGNELADMVAGWDITILGTDINQEFLARASEARFDNWALRAGPEDLKNRYFEAQERSWVLRPEYKRWVSFQHHNLVKDACPSEFDLILCRNVMIYFSRQIIRETVDRLYHCLAEDAWLLVGHAELNSETFRSFRTVNLSGVTVYQKSQARPVPAAPVPAAITTSVSKPVRSRAGDGREGTKQRSAVRQKVARPAVTNLEEVRVLADRGQWKDAASRCRSLIEADSLNAAAYFISGLILEHTGSGSEAELALRRAIYLDRAFVLAHYHLGLLLQRSKETTQARRAFENVLELLKRKPDGERLEHGDGITVEQLKQLTSMHLELLGNA